MTFQHSQVSKNVLAVHLSQEAIGGCTVSKMKRKTKKEEDEMQHMKEKRQFSQDGEGQDHI